MSVIPTHLRKPYLTGLNLVHQGKVRDTFELPDRNLLLPVATDRISIFDIVLNGLVRYKGEVLTALNIFWRTQVLRKLQHDLVAFGRGIDEYLPPDLRGNRNLWRRATVVRRLNMLPVEAIVRGHLTGSGLKDYQKTGAICGNDLPAGLKDGSKLPDPIFTPSTKAEIGHDENVSAGSVTGQFGEAIESLSLTVFSIGKHFAYSVGLIVADSKFELGYLGEIPPSGKVPLEMLVLADEVLTPDSSRFWGARQS